MFSSGQKIARISEMFEFFLALFYVGELVIVIAVMLCTFINWKICVN